MRRLIIILLTLVPLGASAQSRAIEALAEKYANRDGFSTTLIKGNLSKGFAGSLNIEVERFIPRNATRTLRDT